MILTLSFLLTAFIGLNLMAAEKSKSTKAQLLKSGVQRIEIKVTSYSFDPEHIIVEVNKPVEFILKSHSKIVPHNIAMDYPEAGLEIDQDISPGKEVKITFTPKKLGTFEFYCNKKGLFGSHKKKGMKGILEVKE
jgi:plastocyanin domain-containing protein